MTNMVKGYKDEDGLHVYCVIWQLVERSAHTPHKLYDCYLTPGELLRYCPECGYEDCPIKKIVERVREGRKNE